MSVVDVQIQTNVKVIGTPQLTRDSSGNLYVVYKKNTDNHLYIAYSSDSGLTWTEVDSTSNIASGGLASLAVNSTNVVSVAYIKTTVPSYRQFTVSGGWTSEETISSASDGYNRGGIAVSIDSSDNVHVTWAQKPAADNHDAIYYSKRTAGTWASRTLIYQEGSGIGSHDQCFPEIALDSSNFIYIVWVSVITAGILYAKYTSSWTTAVSIGSTAVTDVSAPFLAVDSSDNVHVVWSTSSLLLKYTKYTASSGLWSAEATVTTSVNVANVSISVDASNNLNVFFSDDSSPRDSYFIQNTGSWGAESKILDASAPNSFGTPLTQSTVWPLVGGSHTNIPTSGYQLTYINTVAGTNIIRYYSSPASFPAPQTQIYSRQANASLPSTDSNLSHLFTTTEYTNVATENLVYVDQTATNQYSLFEFKNQNTVSTQPISAVWIGKTSVAPASSTVFLQIYNQNSATWETLSSNNTAPINTNFTLSGTQNSSLSNYYATGSWVSLRVYQLAV